MKLSRIKTGKKKLQKNGTKQLKSSSKWKKKTNINKTNKNQYIHIVS